MQEHTHKTWWLVCGDGLVILVLSIAGYLTHYAGQESFSLRWMSTFFPFWLGWTAAALLGGLYSAGIQSRWQTAVWRGAVAGILAAPFATMLRGLYLNTAVSPLFMIVLTATAGLALAVWRASWALLARRMKFYG